jgi:hypothetical protein
MSTARKQNRLYENSRYRVEEVAEGVYGVIEIETGKRIDNFSRPDLAVARAQKLEGSVTKTYGWAAEE